MVPNKISFTIIPEKIYGIIIPIIVFTSLFISGLSKTIPELFYWLLIISTLLLSLQGVMYGLLGYAETTDGNTERCWTPLVCLELGAFPWVLFMIFSNI